MKKSLIALAVLAASGAAMAQSNVTLYGIVDAYVGSTKDTTATNKERQTVVGSGGLKSSRWGMRGTEDLGGGLKASFKLEQRYKADTGAIDGVNFKGESSVGLSGGFGSVIVGRTGTAYDDLRDKTNPIGDTNISPVEDTFKMTKSDYAGTIDNAIVYSTPKMGGFSAAIGISLGENKTDTLSATQHTSLLVRYNEGPLLVGYGYQKEESYSDTNNDGVPDVALANLKEATYHLIAASYDFGVAKVVGGYQTAEHVKANVKEGDNDGYYFGIQAPVASNVNLFFGYTGAEYDAVAAGKDVKSTGYTLAANYVLSKRTDAYVGYKVINKDNDTTGLDLGKSQTFAVGVRHTF